MGKRNSCLGAFLLGALCGFLPTSMLLFSSMMIKDNITPAAVYRSVSALVETYSTAQQLETKTTTYHTDLTLHKILYRYQDKGEEAAHEMANNIRILCLVLTQPVNHMTKAVHIRDTWGKRCNILLFVSSKNDSTLPSVSFNISESRNYLFDKTKAAMKYVYKYYMDSVDWILKADDDTFVVVENLRQVLSKHNSSSALYLGCRFKPFTKQGFMSGGAGYVLSKAALKKFVEEAIVNKTKCLQSGIGNGEDVEMGICLENVNVTAVDTRDNAGRGRFFPFHPQFHLFPNHNSSEHEWYWKYQYYADPEGLNCCSDSAASFHYVSPTQLQVLNYLLYTIRPYGTSLYYNKVKEIKIKL